MSKEIDLASAVDELIAIKRLLILSLMRQGASQRDIASSMGISQASVSRLMTEKPTGKPSRKP